MHRVIESPSIRANDAKDTEIPLKPYLIIFLDIGDRVL